MWENLISNNITFDYIVGVASILGFLLSGLAAYGVGKLRSNYKQKARIPEAVSELTKLSKSILKNYKNWREGQLDAKSEIKRAAPILKSQLSYISNPEKSQLQKLAYKIDPPWWKKYIEKSKGSKEEVWERYESIVTATEILNQLNKNNQWN